MLFLMLACSTPVSEPVIPVPPPPPTLRDDLRSLSQRVGLAARDADSLCQALTKAEELQPRVQNAIQAGDLNKDDLRTGLVIRGESVRVDWIEIAQAAGPGATNAALITLGGMESVVYRPCVDVQKLSQWVNRTKSFQKTAGCVQDFLTDKLEDLLIKASQAPCICALPPKDSILDISTRVEDLGIHNQEFLNQWSATWSVCPTTQP